MALHSGQRLVAVTFFSLTHESQRVMERFLEDHTRSAAMLATIGATRPKSDTGVPFLLGGRSRFLVC
jgi:hypothetical protein